MRFVGVVSAGRALPGPFVRVTAGLLLRDPSCGSATSHGQLGPPTALHGDRGLLGEPGWPLLGGGAWRCRGAAATAEISQRLRCGSGTLRSPLSCGAVVTKLWVRAPSLLASL